MTASWAARRLEEATALLSRRGKEGGSRSAQDDQRPAWPHAAADLIQQGHIHEITELYPGHLLELVSIEHPTNGTLARAEAYFLCRRP